MTAAPSVHERATATVLTRYQDAEQPSVFEPRDLSGRIAPGTISLSGGDSQLRFHLRGWLLPDGSGIGVCGRSGNRHGATGSFSRQIGRVVVPVVTVAPSLSEHLDDAGVGEPRCSASDNVWMVPMRSATSGFAHRK